MRPTNYDLIQNDEVEASFTKKLKEDKGCWIDPVAGDDLNPGTELLPFKTIQHAYDIIPKNLNNHFVQILLKSGTYTELINALGFINGEIDLSAQGAVIITNPDVPNPDDIPMFNIGGGVGANLQVLGEIDFELTGSAWKVVIGASGQCVIDGCKFGDDGTTATIGIDISGDLIKLSNLTDSGINKVSIGIVARYGIARVINCNFGDIPFIHDYSGFGNHLGSLIFDSADIRGGSILQNDVTYYINPAGDDANDGLTLATPFQHIQHAIDILPKNLNGWFAQISLTAGTYDETPDIEKFSGGAFGISGQDPTNTIITLDNTWFVGLNNTAIGYIQNLTLLIKQNDIPALQFAHSYYVLGGCFFGAINGSINGIAVEVSNGATVYSQGNSDAPYPLTTRYKIDDGGEVVIGADNFATNTDINIAGIIVDENNFLTTPATAPEKDYEVANKKYVDDNTHTQNTDLYLDTAVTNILYVDGMRGDTYTPNGTITKPFKKIQDAIDAVTSPSATNKYLIDIAPGAYYSDALAINKVYITFRSCGVQGARISGAITVTNPGSPTPEQITFVGLRISGGLTCLASHIAINCIDCNVTGTAWTFTPTTPTDDEYLQVWGGLWNANVTLDSVYAYLMGGGNYSTWDVTDKEFNINNADINTPFQVTLSGTVIASAYGNRVGSSAFILNTGSTLYMDADTEGGSIITLSGGTLIRTTKAGNIVNVPAGNIVATNVQAAIDELDSEKIALDVDSCLEIPNNVYFTAEVDNGNGGASKTIDWKSGNKQVITLTADCILTFTAPSGACSLSLRVIQNATGGWLLTYPGNVKWSGGAPTLSTGANAVDILSFYYDGTNYYGMASLNFV